MASAPLWDGTADKVICEFGKSEYFCKRGWTRTTENSPVICPSGCLDRADTVIPGHREAMSPESITPIRGYGFRACAKRRIPE
jgi:hypothetical protein